MVDDPGFQIDIPIFSKFKVQHVLLFGSPCLTHLLLMSLDYLLVSTWLCPEDCHCSQFSVSMFRSSTKKIHHTSLMEQQRFSTCDPKKKGGGLEYFWNIFCAASMPHRPVTAPLSSSAPLSPSEMPVGSVRCTAVARASWLSCKDHIIIWFDIILISWIFMNQNHTIIISQFFQLKLSKCWQTTALWAAGAYRTSYRSCHISDRSTSDRGQGPLQRWNRKRMMASFQFSKWLVNGLLLVYIYIYA